jgi:gamma-glutamyltranspeptidase / glutathione hydrolase
MEFPSLPRVSGNPRHRIVPARGGSRAATGAPTWLATPWLLIALGAPASATAQDTGDPLARTIPAAEEIEVVRSSHGIAATLNVEASRAAVDVLERGGTAIDAAAAAWLVLTVVSPNQTGLGAGGYILYHDAATGQTVAIDANVRAPAEAHPGVFLDEDGEPLSNTQLRARGLAVGVPGMVRGFDVALKRWGTRYFDELSAHAIRLAEEGWEVDRELASRIRQMQGQLQPAAREVFVPGGVPLEPGDMLVQPGMARSLRLLAEEGSAAFYQGEIARAIARHVQELGGVLTEEDLHRYNVSVDPPLWLEYRGHQVATTPNNMGGATLAILLRLLEGFDLPAYAPRSAERYHLFMEAARVAGQGAGALFADPEFVDRPWRALLSEAFIAERRAQILPDRRNPSIEATDPWAFQPGGPYRTRSHHPAYEEPDNETLSPDAAPEGTDHFTIVDGEGNVAVVTSTLGTAWTAGHMVPDYGFILNVTGAYFDPAPGGAHEVRPGKRPRSSMTPTLAFRNGSPVVSVGSPSPAGMQHVQVLLNVLDHGLDPAHAIAEPRVASGGSWELGVPDDVLDALRALGHDMDEEWSDRGAVPLLLWDGVMWRGASDPRRQGVAIGAGPAADRR